jgi:putative ABC transport system permease protein
MRQLLRRAWYVLRQGRFEADLAEEMEFHRAMKQDELERSGVKPDEAAFGARRALGSIALSRNRARDVWIWPWFQDLSQDIRFALRLFVQDRRLSVTAVLILALGIGANTAIFSLLNSLSLRTLPVKEPHRLAVVFGGTPVPPGLPPLEGYTYAIWQTIQSRRMAFDGVGAWSMTRFNLAESGEMRQVDGLLASGDFFPTLGVEALVGRTFTTADDVRGGGRDGAVAVISYAFWHREFAGATNVVGKPVTIEGVPFTVIGITPPEFLGTEVGRAFDVVIPITSVSMIGRGAQLDSLAWYLRINLRLKPGQSLDSAIATLRGIQPQIREASMPKEYDRFPEFQAEFLKGPLTLLPAASGTSTLRQRYQRPLLTIFGVVVVVLLIACATIGNLLIARASVRRHELSVRLALGASRWRLARQLLVETLMLSTVGAALGLLLASWGSRALVAQFSTQINPVALDLSLDWRVLGFTSAVMIATAMLFGTAPALYAVRVTPSDVLKEHGGGAGERTRLSAVLVLAQVALSLVLVVATGLFLRTFLGLATLPLGFDADKVLVVNVNATRANIAPANRVSLYLQLAEAVAAVPGVAHAGGSLVTPVANVPTLRLAEVPGAPAMPEREREALAHIITPGWLAAYGTPLRSGRDVGFRDGTNAPAVALVNEAFVRKFLPGRDPLGATVSDKTIVGVVADAVYRSLRDPLQPTLYEPLAQTQFRQPPANISISVRAVSGSPMLLAPAVATAITNVDRNLAFTFRSLADQVNASLIQERAVALLSGFFGWLALLLAAVGLYGVTSYAISRRRQEIGLRIALGAEPAAVVRLVLSRVSFLVVLGIMLGLGMSWWAVQLIASLLYGLQPRDPLTFAGAAAILALVGLLAGCLPAYRASRIDPAVVLRNN